MTPTEDGPVQDGGFTLVEMLVAMLLFSLISGTMLTAVVATGSAVQDSRQQVDLNEEARVMLNRMSRELREARSIVAVSNPGPVVNTNASAGPLVAAGCSTFVGSTTLTGSSTGAAGNSSITFEVDFNGNGTIEPTADDPEQLTYSFDNVQQRVLLQAGGVSVPVLAANVSSFRISYLSRKSQYDGTCDPTKDGLVWWTDLDRHGKPFADGSSTVPSPVGNGNGVLDQELDAIDSVIIDVTVLRSPREQTYRTQIDLRNRPNQ